MKKSAEFLGRALSECEALDIKRLAKAAEKGEEELLFFEEKRRKVILCGSLILPWKTGSLL